ncbi:hypothetical protein O181_054703 [Austropuccinia psidii MF-1]|uniref:Integrase catalytic domain-containing protein n=1 Tax=Austropuccinia psidii MF-1 TaxID=1389203 RepID=A0A9Q3HRP1_9BASI|nr:hypothetical protein [Austropuccinia psidii MF-1]
MGSVKDRKDWHAVLGHPSDKYIKKLFDNKKLSASLISSNECQVCLHAKLKRLPYSWSLPTTYSPFIKIHIDTLEISPPSQQGNHYVLGISLEREPPDSPQTNGVAERFNQSLLTKIRCLMAQSNILISLWEEAAVHASMLLNHLPHKFLSMKSPNDLLVSRSSTIQPVNGLNQLLPFRIKVMVKNESPISKVHLVGKFMKALTYEPCSDALRVLDTISGKIKITQDFSQLKSNTTTVYHEPVSRKEISSKGAKSRYTYVPYYDTAPLDVSSSISTQNIIEVERRQRRPPDRFMLADVVTYKQAMSNPNKEEAWRSAMKLEYDSLMKHNTGELVPYPSNGAKVIGGMWRLTQKRNEFGHVYWNKAQWVVLGNHQEHLLHYFYTWALVSRNETFKLLLILVVNQGYIPYQFDIKTAFLHGEMDANIYVKKVKGFKVPGKEGWVWRLKKSLYGTKKASRMWQAKLVSVLKELELTSTRADNSLYSNQDRRLFLHVHVDDGFLIGNNEKDLLIFLEKLNRKLSLKYQKKPTHNLGYCLDWATNGTVYLSQQDLILQFLRDHDMDGSWDVKTPCNGNLLKELESVGDPVRITAFQQEIGSLEYLAQHTRPDISYTVNALSRHIAHPTDKHWVALKHLLRYLKGSSGLFSHYKRTISKEHDVIGWANANYVND